MLTTQEEESAGGLTSVLKVHEEEPAGVLTLC